MELIEAIQWIKFDPTWGIWAEKPFSPESRAVFGRTYFWEDQDPKDGMVFFADGFACESWLMDHGAGEDSGLTPELLAKFGAKAAREMIAVYAEATADYIW